MSTRYYVSVIDGVRRGLLLGSFSTHTEALARVDVVRAWCVDRDPCAVWYGFGTAGVRGALYPAGRLNGERAALRRPCRLPPGQRCRDWQGRSPAPRRKRDRKGVACLT